MGHLVWPLLRSKNVEVVNNWDDVMQYMYTQENFLDFQLGYIIPRSIRFLVDLSPFRYPVCI